MRRWHYLPMDCFWRYKLALPDNSILEVNKNCLEQNICNNSIQINGCTSAFEHILSCVSVPCISSKVENFQPSGAVFKIPVIFGFFASTNVCLSLFKLGHTFCDRGIFHLYPFCKAVLWAPSCMFGNVGKLFSTFYYCVICYSVMRLAKKLLRTLPTKDCSSGEAITDAGCKCCPPVTLVMPDFIPKRHNDWEK